MGLRKKSTNEGMLNGAGIGSTLEVTEGTSDSSSACGRISGENEDLIFINLTYNSKTQNDAETSPC